MVPIIMVPITIPTMIPIILIIMVLIMVVTTFEMNVLILTIPLTLGGKHDVKLSRVLVNYFYWFWHIRVISEAFPVD